MQEVEKSKVIPFLSISSQKTIEKQLERPIQTKESDKIRKKVRDLMNWKKERDEIFIIWRSVSLEKETMTISSEKQNE